MDTSDCPKNLAERKKKELVKDDELMRNSTKSGPKCARQRRRPLQK